MDTTRILELLAHYFVMLLLVFGALAVMRAALGDMGFWFELVVVIIIAFAYRPIVIRLGVAPTAWEER
ncbi:putative membrane protein [Halanaeroarchaeum sp. HSR-CO]|uniref:hypothetical protein n=1 Tax=Halanaeroarchaeum sp. HSR-CO TaxID=2866382 RepID=UPI00217EB3D8|nr:hypothetical protein [Halanaeroarchaeum sp. HSR-CO]UWG46512.1 putative membrane protein [Halanaeroarchaeum sp. HSR-CO]